MAATGLATDALACPLIWVKAKGRALPLCPFILPCWLQYRHDWPAGVLADE